MDEAFWTGSLPDRQACRALPGSDRAIVWQIHRSRPRKSRCARTPSHRCRAYSSRPYDRTAMPGVASSSLGPEKQWSRCAYRAGHGQDLPSPSGRARAGPLSRVADVAARCFFAQMKYCSAMERIAAKHVFRRSQVRLASRSRAWKENQLRLSGHSRVHSSPMLKRIPLDPTPASFAARPESGGAAVHLRAGTGVARRWHAGDRRAGTAVFGHSVRSVAREISLRFTADLIRGFPEIAG